MRITEVKISIVQRYLVTLKNWLLTVSVFHSSHLPVTSQPKVTSSTSMKLAMLFHVASITTCLLP